MSDHTDTPTLTDERPATSMPGSPEEAHRREDRRVRAAAGADDPDQIRDEIRATRARMDATLNSLEHRVAPSKVAERSRARVASRWRRLRTSVMGSPGPTSSSSSSSSSRSSSRGPGELASDAADTVRDAPQEALSSTRGNPFAAGMIAFGLGALVAGALPESDQEQRLAEDAADRVDLERVRAETEQALQDVREPVEERVQQGAEQVKQAARSEASDMQDEAQQSKERVAGDPWSASEQGPGRTGSA